jgi:hypothetical protein
MTIEGWSLGAAWTGVCYMAEKASEIYSAQATTNDDDEPGTKIEPVDLTKLVESISGSIFIAMLAMMPEKTKIHIEDNLIKFDAPWLLQGWYRTGVASRLDFKKYKIFYRTITMPQNWYAVGSDEAKAIARIQRISILGMKMIKKMYRDDYVPDHVKKYKKSAIRFIQKNDLPITLEPPAELKLSDLQKDEKLDDSQEEIKLNDSHAKSQQQDSDYDEDDDLLSDIADEDKQIAALATDSNSSNIMKSLYSKKELISFADRLETVWEHFQSDDPLVKEQVEGELKGLIGSLLPKIKLYQKKMQEDLRKRY